MKKVQSINNILTIYFFTLIANHSPFDKESKALWHYLKKMSNIFTLTSVTIATGSIGTLSMPST